jgi:hypothetical protein
LATIRQKKTAWPTPAVFGRAGDGTQTRDPQLGSAWADNQRISSRIIGHNKKKKLHGQHLQFLVERETGLKPATLSLDPPGRTINGFPPASLATIRQKKTAWPTPAVFGRAGDGTQTRDPQLGSAWADNQRISSRIIGHNKAKKNCMANTCSFW